MTTSLILIPKQKLKDPSQQEKTDPIRRLCGLPTPTFFAVVSALLIAFSEWPRSWHPRGYCVDLLHTARSLERLPYPTIRTIVLPSVQVLHRVPMLLRLILFALSYFHQISIKSITAAGSGKWISHI